MKSQDNKCLLRASGNHSMPRPSLLNTSLQPSGWAQRQVAASKDGVGFFSRSAPVSSAPSAIPHLGPRAYLPKEPIHTSQAKPNSHRLSHPIHPTQHHQPLQPSVQFPEFLLWAPPVFTTFPSTTPLCPPCEPQFILQDIFQTVCSFKTPLAGPALLCPTPGVWSEFPHYNSWVTLQKYSCLGKFS